MKNKNQGKISIVGAGPGDKDLITVKGLRAIASANIILYDALVNKELLQEAPQDCKLIYVGKRAGKHTFSQARINELLVSSFNGQNRVVRLKGGDPFIFGRGHEELEYCRQFHVPVEIVPGISSSTSLPQLQHVPLTRRGISESFWVITGTTTKGQLASDIYTAAQTSATLVVLMGIRKIPKIAETLIAIGKKNTPIMVIQNGSIDQEKLLLTTAEYLVEDAAVQQIATPGIIVIGEVVRLHPQLIVSETKHLWRA